MKVDELRVKLYKLGQDEVIRLAVEFYKLVPKAKKEEYNLDELINTPEVKTAKPAAIENLISFENMANEVNTFVENAKNQYYLFPNKIIAKKDRATWRFKVKAWYKDVTNPKTFGFDMVKKAEICVNLYNVLCESCHFQYFSSEDTFNSVGVEQTVFFRSALQLIDQTEGRISLLNRGLEMAIDNPTGPNTLNSWVMQEFVNILDAEPLKYDAIEKVEKMIADNQAPPPAKNQKRHYYEDSSAKYYRDKKTNDLVEMGFRLYTSIYQYEEAIVFYNKYTIQNSDEVKLYILVRLLFESGQKTHIQSVLESAIASGLKPRESLIKLLETIKKDNVLPQYMR
jgi:hypothetical protein